MQFFAICRPAALAGARLHTYPVCRPEGTFFGSFPLLNSTAIV
jgi:hypothetical protein